MSVATARFDAAIDRLGETITWTKLNGSAGSFAHTCIVRVASSGELSAFLDDVEIMGVAKPGILLVGKADLTVIINDTFTRDSLNYIVLKVFSNRLDNEVVSKTALVSKV